MESTEWDANHNWERINEIVTSGIRTDKLSAYAILAASDKEVIAHSKAECIAYHGQLVNENSFDQLRYESAEALVVCGWDLSLLRALNL